MPESPEKKPKWRLLFWRTAVVVAFVLYTFIGFVVVPWIARGVVLPKISEKLGQEITVEKIRVNPFTLALTIEGLTLPDRSGAPMLSFDEMYANLQASSLFKRALVLKEFRVENPYAAIRRFADKEINLLEVLKALDSGEKDPNAEGGLPRAILQEIRMIDGRFELEDQARDEPLLWEAGPSQLHWTDISTIPDEKGTNDFVIGLPEGGTIRINGEVVVEPLGLDGSLSIDKMLLDKIWLAARERFEFDLVGGAVATNLDYQIRIEDDDLRLAINGASFRLTDLDLRTKDDEVELASIDSIEVSGVEAIWPAQRVRAESILVDGAAARVWIEPDGSPSWAKLVPKETQDEIVETYKRIEDRINVDARLGRFEVRNATASFENRTFDEPHRIEVTDASLALTDVSSEPGSQWGLAASTAVGGESRAIAKGTFVAAPLTLDADVALENLELAQFQAYVEKLAPLQLLAGKLTAAGKLHVAPAKQSSDITYAGGLAVNDLDLIETVTDGTLIGWGDLRVEGIEAALAPMSLKVAEVNVYRAGLEIVVAEDGTINLLEFKKALSSQEGEEPASVDEPAATEVETKSTLPPAAIGRLQLHDCYGIYRDATTPMPFERKLASINGSISKIDTRSSAGAELDIAAAIDSGGSVTVTGRIDPFNYARLADLAVDIHDIQLPPMSPMSVKILGYPIEQGRTSLDVDYLITDYQLQGTNHVEVKNLQLGGKVEGEGKIKAPIKMGVSLLKDKNGMITLDIPIAGDLRDPEFVMTSAISGAVAGVTGELMKSPFRILGRMAGGADDQDLEFVDFHPGSAALSSAVTGNLAILVKAFQERPALGLEITGTFDPQVDREALREAALYRELGLEPPAPGRGLTVPMRQLESRHEKQTSPSQTARLRGRYMSEDGSLDDQGFSETLWAQLLAAQEVDEAALAALAPARAEAIRAYLVDDSGLDSGRVTVLPKPVTVETGQPRIRCQLVMTSNE